MSESRNIISVTALNEYVKRGLEGSRYLSSLLVAGEISNLSVKGGHLYFSLKDKGGAVSAIMFRSYAERMERTVSFTISSRRNARLCASAIRHLLRSVSRA